MIVTIFCNVDDFCKFYHKEFSLRMLQNGKKKGNRTSRMSLSEVMTISIYYHYSGYKTFKDYYQKCILGHLKGCFYNPVSYNRFLELKAAALSPIAFFSITMNSCACTGVSFIDSYPLNVCHNKRIYSHKTFKGIAKRGVSSMGWFFGFKLHVVINHKGEIQAFCLTSGNVHDANLALVKKLTKKMFGKLFGDKGYLGKKLFKNLWIKVVKMITKTRKNMKKRSITKEEEAILGKRGVVESVGNILKNVLSINHTRHRSMTNFFVGICSGLLAYAFREKKPSIQVCNNLTA